MNKDRRKTIDAIRADVEKLSALGGARQAFLDAHAALAAAVEEKQQAVTDAWDALKEEVGGLRDQIEEVRDAEQEGFDNLPEGLQQGERGEAMTTAIEALQSAHDSLGQITDADWEEVTVPDADEMGSGLDDAATSLEEAGQ